MIAWLSQIPNVSNKIADAILSAHETIETKREFLGTNPRCIYITTETEKGQKRKINKRLLLNIKAFFSE